MNEDYIKKESSDLNRGDSNFFSEINSLQMRRKLNFLNNNHNNNYIKEKKESKSQTKIDELPLYLGEYHNAKNQSISISSKFDKIENEKLMLKNMNTKLHFISLDSSNLEFIQDKDNLNFKRDEYNEEKKNSEYYSRQRKKQSIGRNSSSNISDIMKLKSNTNKHKLINIKFNKKKNEIKSPIRVKGNAIIVDIKNLNNENNNEKNNKIGLKISTHYLTSNYEDYIQTVNTEKTISGSVIKTDRDIRFNQKILHFLNSKNTRNLLEIYKGLYKNSYHTKDSSKSFVDSLIIKNDFSKNPQIKDFKYMTEKQFQVYIKNLYKNQFKRILEILSVNLKKHENINSDILIINGLIIKKKFSFSIKLKDLEIFYQSEGYINNYFSIDKTSCKLNQIGKNYENYQEYFCKPFFKSIAINKIIEKNSQRKGEMFYYKNYIEKKNKTNQQGNILIFDDILQEDIKIQEVKINCKMNSEEYYSNIFFLENYLTVKNNDVDRFYLNKTFFNRYFSEGKKFNKTDKISSLMKISENRKRVENLNKLRNNSFYRDLPGNESLLKENDFDKMIKSFIQKKQYPKRYNSMQILKLLKKDKELILFDCEINGEKDEINNNINLRNQVYNFKEESENSFINLLNLISEKNHNKLYGIDPNYVIIKEKNLFINKNKQLSINLNDKFSKIHSSFQPLPLPNLKSKKKSEMLSVNYDEEFLKKMRLTKNLINKIDETSINSSNEIFLDKNNLFYGQDLNINKIIKKSKLEQIQQVNDESNGLKIKICDISKNLFARKKTKIQNLEIKENFMNDTNELKNEIFLQNKFLNKNKENFKLKFIEKFKKKNQENDDEKKNASIKITLNPADYEMNLTINTRRNTDDNEFYIKSNENKDNIAIIKDVLKRGEIKKSERVKKIDIFNENNEDNLNILITNEIGTISQGVCTLENTLVREEEKKFNGQLVSKKIIHQLNNKLNIISTEQILNIYNPFKMSLNSNLMKQTKTKYLNDSYFIKKNYMITSKSKRNNFKSKIADIEKNKKSMEEKKNFNQLNYYENKPKNINSGKNNQRVYSSSEKKKENVISDNEKNFLNENFKNKLFFIEKNKQKNFESFLKSHEKKKGIFNIKNNNVINNNFIKSRIDTVMNVTDTPTFIRSKMKMDENCLEKSNQKLLFFSNQRINSRLATVNGEKSKQGKTPLEKNFENKDIIHMINSDKLKKESPQKCKLHSKKKLYK